MKQYHKIQTVFLRDPETRLKTLLEGEFALKEFNFLKNNKWVFTEKVDGTNIRVRYRGGKIGFEGKSDSAQIPGPLLDRLEERFGSEADKFGEIFSDADVCLYGEGFGPKIQSGAKYGESHDFVLFDVRIGDLWLERHNVEDIACNLAVPIVPVVGKGTLSDMVDYVRHGFDSQWGSFLAEGIVARPEVELTSRNGSRIITKIKHRDFPKS